MTTGKIAFSLATADLVDSFSVKVIVRGFYDDVDDLSLGLRLAHPLNSYFSASWLKTVSLRFRYEIIRMTHNLRLSVAVLFELLFTIPYDPRFRKDS
jgi:hypothetical protein